ncbi:MAG: MMPL family transporter [Bacteroidales bacterium]
MTGIILKHRYLIIIISIVVTIGGLLLMPGMKTDPDIRNYIPHDMESRINTDLIEKEFGVQDMIMILFRDSVIITEENLLRIKKIDREISRLSSVEKTISLFNTKHIYSQDGAMVVDPAVKRIPSSREETEKLRQELSENPLAMKLVVSSDFTTAAIAATIDKSEPEEKTLARIDSIIAANPGRAEVFTGGLPYIRKGILKDVKRDGLILIPVALIIMLLFLWLAFREWKGMVLPFTVVAMSIALSMGLAPLLGWKMSIISLIVPIMLIAVANDYGIHMIAKYQEVLRENPSMRMEEIVKIVVRKLRKPVIFTGLTTIAGVLGLLTHSIIPARHVGVLTAVGIAFAIVLTLFMLPAWLSMLQPGVKSVSTGVPRRNMLDRLLAKVANLVIKYPVRVLVISAILTIVCASGIFLIRVDSNQENFFPHKHPVRVASELISREFGGSQNISVMVRGDIKDPELLNKLDSWETRTGEIEGVGNVFSIAQVVKR